jgi:23S rRNA pseudouridine2605 synthase
MRQTREKRISPIRIQKYLSLLGVAPRRQVDDALTRGEIQIDGQVAKPGDRIIPGQQTLLWGGKSYRQVVSEDKQTIAMYKPRGVLSSHSDPHHPHTIFSLLPAEYQHQKWILAGRLDKESEGLLLLSEDGALVQKITHPSYGIPKTYEVWIDSISWSPADSDALLQGIEDEGEFLRAEEISFPKRIDNQVKLKIVLKQGHKREIRRLMKSRKKPVARLIRVRIGDIALGKLTPGECRLLAPYELRHLASARRSRNH